MSYKIRNDYEILNFIFSSYTRFGIYKQGEAVKIRSFKGEQEIIGYVDFVVDNWLTGETTYSVLPTRIDPDLPDSEKEKIREKQSIVYVLSKGSESPKATWGSFIDWVPNNGALGINLLWNTVLEWNSRGNLRSVPYITPQARSTVYTVNAFMGKYPGASFIYGGHSQGATNLQYALANIENPNRVIAAFLSEGPNIYPLLSDEKQQVIKKMNNRIFNFVDTKDIVPYGYSDMSKMVGQFLQLQSVSIDKVDQHMTKGYRYDKKGNAILQNYEMAARHHVNLISFYLVLKQHQLNEYFKSYRGTNLNIYIEYRTVEAILDALNLTIYNEISALKDNINDAIQEFDTIWEKYMSNAKEVAPKLSNDEILAVMASKGVTFDSMVTIPKSKFSKLDVNVDSLYKEFQELVRQVKSSIREIQTLDAQISETFLHD